MIRQFRIDRFNGLEFLVCEVYFKHTWTQSESDAFQRFLADDSVSGYLTRDDFRILLDEWLDKEHSPGDSFFGLSEPIPVIETLPHLVLRGVVVSNRIASLQVDYLDSVTPLVVIDCVSKFYEFVRSPHWRNTIATNISNYGSLFGTEDNS